MMKKFSMFVILVALSLIPALADNAAVVGSWDCEIYVDMVGQSYPFKLILQEVDGALTGKASSESQGETQMNHLKFVDNTLSYDIDTAEAGNIEFKLQINGNELTGTGGNWDFEGKVTGKKVE